jgi:tetratricopeptide (TPR) repeat protein
LDVTAPVASPTAQQNQMLRKMVRIAALALVIGVALFVALYLLDQHTETGPSLADRKVATLEQAVRENPQGLVQRLQLAAAYTAAGRSTEASAQYDEVLKESPQNVAALLGKADIFSGWGNSAAALPLYQRVITVRGTGEYAAADTQLEHAYYSVGLIDIANRQFAGAIAALESAVRIDGADADAWYQLGVAQLDAGVPDKAVAAERNAVAFVPLEWADPYATMAKAYTALGKTEYATWAGAMTDLIAKRYAQAKQALEPLVIGPAAVDANLALGFLAEMQGDNTGAVAWYRKTLALDAQNANALSGVARLAGGSPVPSVRPSGSAPAGSG